MKENKILYEAVFSGKNLRDMSDDDWADRFAKVSELVDKVEPVTYLKPEDRISRLNRIKQIKTNPIVKKDLEKEANIEISKDYQKKKAKEDEGKKFKNYRPIEAFKINFYNTIKNQVAQVIKEYQSYSEVNAEYEGEDVIMKADVERTLPEEARPVIDLYFDRSGSWDDGNAISIGKQIVSTIQDFADRGEIILNVLYFDDYVTADENDRGLGDGGTDAWNDILQNIKTTKADNVVLMTDRDMERDAERGPVCKVDGYVWFIWRLRSDDDTGGVYIPQRLIGRKGTSQFAFNSRTDY